MSLVAVIKQRRVALGWSQSEMARRLSELAGIRISVATVGHWETGRNGVPSKHLPLLARVLRFSEEDKVAAFATELDGAHTERAA